MILGAEDAGLLAQVKDDKLKSAERSPFWRVRIIPLTLRAVAADLRVPFDGGRPFPKVHALEE